MKNEIPISVIASYHSDYSIILYSMKIDKSNSIRHTTATIVMQSLITGLLEVVSQMMMSIDVSHDRIT